MRSHKEKRRKGTCSELRATLTLRGKKGGKRQQRKLEKGQRKCGVRQVRKIEGEWKTRAWAVVTNANPQSGVPIT